MARRSPGVASFRTGELQRFEASVTRASYNAECNAPPNWVAPHLLSVTFHFSPFTPRPHLSPLTSVVHPSFSSVSISDTNDSMLADIASPIYISPPGLFVVSVISLAVIILIEATVLRLRRWGSWKIAFLHAFIINLVTSVIGTGLVLFATQAKLPWELSAPFLFVAAFFFTIFVEAVELKVLRLSAPFPRAFLNSMAPNVFS